jgi:hypothetical protein
MGEADIEAEQVLWQGVSRGEDVSHSRAPGAHGSRERELKGLHLREPWPSQPPRIEGSPEANSGFEREMRDEADPIVQHLMVAYNIRQIFISTGF